VTSPLFISFVAAGFALLAPSVNAMTDMPDCTIQVAEDTLHLDAADLGTGMTSYLEAIEDKGTFLVVTSCFTGSYLRATIWSGPEARRTEYPAAMEEFAGATGPNVVVSIGQLAEMFEARDVPTSYGLNRVETCACAAAYPGLRGTKEGYIKQ